MVDGKEESEGKERLEKLWERSRNGDHAAFAQLFDIQRQQLISDARRGLGQHVQRRVDASDIVQEVFLEADRRLAELVRTELPQLAWLRVLLKQKIVDCKRAHLGAAKRSMVREQSLQERVADVDSIANQLVASLTSPSMKVCRQELRDQIQILLSELSTLDRQILVLRHFEGKSNREVADELDLSVNAASNRYVRAIRRFKAVLDASDDELGYEHPVERRNT